MKSYSVSFLLTFCLVLGSLSGFAQKQVTEGVINYHVIDIKGGGMEAGMMEGSKQSFYFDSEYQKMDVFLMNDLVKVQILTNNIAKNNLLMMEGLTGKVMVRSDEESAKKQMVIPQYKISYDKSDTRMIAGYSCHKAILKSGDGTSLVCYVTEQINPQASFVEKLFKGLKGFPLEYTVKRPGFSVTYKAGEVEKKFDRSVFKPDTAGYQELTPAQWEKNFGKLNLGL